MSSIVTTLALIVPAAAAVAGQPPSQAKPAATSTAKSAAGVTVTPRSGREGTTVTIKYPSAVKGYPQSEQVLIEDPGVHGYYFAHDAGIYITYDDRRDSKYTVPATAVTGTTAKNAYRFTIPEGVCGVILQATQATVTKVPAGAVQGSPTVVGQNVTKYPTRSSSGGKRLEVSIVGQKGKPAIFSLTCDKYTVSVKVNGNPTDVSPLPGASTVSATVTAKGAVQEVVGAKVKTPPDTPNAIIPIGRITVMFTTDFGTMAPGSPAKVVTGPDGMGVVTISSGDPGTATAVAVAEGLGDGHATIEFTAKKKPEPKPGSGQIALGGSATGQCAAETQKRHHDIVAGLQGHPTHEIAQALVDSDTKSPSVAECARKRGGGGGGDDTTAIMQDNGTGNPPLDDTTDSANKSADKTPTTPTTTDTGKTPPKDNPFPKKAVILGGAGAGAAAAILVAKGGGGGGGGTSTGSGGTGGTGGGGGGGFNPTSLNSPPDYKNSVTLAANSCQGSDNAYGETATVNLSSSGAGTITLTDTPNFQRVYQVSGVTALNQMVAASGTFSFLGASVPGTLSVTFTSTTSMTFSEKTNWGSCSNTYTGTLGR